MSDKPFVFPKWTNAIRNVVAGVLLVAPVYVVLLVAYGATPETLYVGYEPEQPVPYSHLLHASELGMDCRYCHNTVDVSKHASIPPTATCINCHDANLGIQKNSPKLALVHESAATGLGIPWVRIHDLPDYAYFSHAAHVNKGVGCVTCHGRVDRMEVVYQAEPLSMGWCIDCHRAPEQHLRPLNEITNMRYDPQVELTLDQRLELKREYNIRDARYLTSCTICHR